VDNEMNKDGYLLPQVF